MTQRGLGENGTLVLLVTNTCDNPATVTLHGKPGYVFHIPAKSEHLVGPLEPRRCAQPDGWYKLVSDMAISIAIIRVP
jgi:hypothetical protein